MTEINQKTERIYYNNSHLLRFNARVLSCEPQGENWVVVLDQTAFYPTGGGQPNDSGQLGQASVLDCIDADDRILHIVDRPLSGEVEGIIDSDRRLDHMQQHTGQHILSQAFIQSAGAQTRSFHLGSDSATIDIELDSFSPELVAGAEDLANRIVFEDRPTRIHLATPDELERYKLRKETDREGSVRIIEIENFDFSPCGGTHAHRTGEVGLIVVRGVERVKRNMCRVEFFCGRRALLDYRAAHSSALATASLFSATRDAAPGLVARLQQENKQLNRRMRELLELALEHEARQLYEAAKPNAEGIRVVCSSFPNRDIEELKTLARAIVALGPSIALLASTGETNRLLFARSKGLAQDCGKMMGEFCRSFGGRGGGAADFAQGGVASETALDAALSELAKSLGN
jgi:alanyl-tRNA synthetase